MVRHRGCRNGPPGYMLAGTTTLCRSQLHRNKRFTSFPSPAGMSLTKLPLDWNNSVMTSLLPHRESLVVTSRLGTGNSRTFFTVYIPPPFRDYGMSLTTSLQEQSRWQLRAEKVTFHLKRHIFHRTHIRISDPATCSLVAPIEMTGKNKVPAYMCWKDPLCVRCWSSG